MGAAAVGTLLAFGTTAIGFAGPAAAVGQPAALTIVSQVNNTASTLSDGTDTKVKLSAVQTQLPTGGNPNIGAVRFDFTETAPHSVSITPIATDSSAPFSVLWTPPENGTYTITAEPLVSAGGGSAGTPATQTVDMNFTSNPGGTLPYPSVHIASPVDGATIPFSTTGSANYVGVTGTRSADPSSGALPSISFKTQLRDDSTDPAVYGLLSDTITTGALVPTGASGDSPSWNTSVPVPTDCPAGHTCDVIINAIASGQGTDEVVQDTLAAAPQTVDSFAVAPGTDASPTVNGTDDTAKTFTVTALAGGVPVPGVKVIAFSNHGSTTTITPPAANPVNTTGTALTNASGQIAFQVFDTADESSTLTFQTEFNGTSYVNGTDFSKTRTYVTAPSTLTTVTLSKTPDQSSYATASYSASNPVIKACLKNQNGDPFQGSTASLIVTVDRSITGGSTSQPTGQLAGSQSPALSGCYQVTINPPTDYPTATQSGTDKYTVYQNNDGHPGFQPGGTDIGDITTVNFSPGVISYDSYSDCSSGTTPPNQECDTQEQVGVVDSITVREVVGGAPVPAGTTLNLALVTGSTHANFPATQPAGGGTTQSDPTHATCSTRADGSCLVFVSDGNVETTELDATDTPAGLTGTLGIDFRANSVAFVKTTREDHNSLFPRARSTDTPLDSSDTRFEDYGAPGAPIVVTYQVKDTDGFPLADIPVTVTIDHGFFTPLPANANDYNRFTFDPAAAAGAAAGSLKSLGQSLPLITDSDGTVTFALGIGRDAAFDGAGRVLTTVKIANGGTTFTAGNPASPSFDPTLLDAYTWTTNTVDTIGPVGSENKTLGDVVTGGALNGASATITPVPGFPFTGNHTSGYTLDDPATLFYVQLKDQFGNLVGSTTSVAETGPGKGTACGSFRSSYNNQIAAGSEPICEVDSTNNSPTTAAIDTVTDTWLTQTTLFAANNNPAVGAVPFVAIQNDGPTVSKTASFTISLYMVDINHLHYAYLVTPAAIVPTTTTVHDMVTVTDQYTQPVEGLFVASQQSGPGPGVDTTGYGTTNEDGTESYNFSSSVEGNATVTINVYNCDVQQQPNCSNVPLSGSVNQIGFDGVPTIAVSPANLAGPGSVSVSGITRPGANVQLYALTNGTYQLLATVKADTDGSYGFTQSISSTTNFRTLVDGLQASAAAIATVGPAAKPTPAVKVTRSGGPLVVGKQIVYDITNIQPGQLVTIQLYKSVKNTGGPGSHLVLYKTVKVRAFSGGNIHLGIKLTFPGMGKTVLNVNDLAGVAHRIVLTYLVHKAT